VLAFIASCATFPGKKSTTTSSPSKSDGTRTIVKTPGEPPREVMRPEAINYAAVQSPKRQVSTQLVMEGKEFLAKKEYDRARGKLEEAVTLDPTNGAAYYHLAVVYYELRDYPKALGFLDQAESLFHASPDWMETIQKFREIIQSRAL
jgi:tetratricopeptide (TPR) repeat protein